MTKIVAGNAKGRILAVPAKGTRPTAVKVREALFSMLDNRGLVAGSKVLDLFAGSGALGLEAFSRGAEKVVLVDSSRGAQKVLADNIRNLRAQNICQVYRGGADAYLQGSQEKFDVIFIDPPYDWTEERLRKVIDAAVGRLEPGGIVVVERLSRSPEPTARASLHLEAKRRWGETAAWLYSAAPAGQNEVD